MNNLQNSILITSLAYSSYFGSCTMYVPKNLFEIFESVINSKIIRNDVKISKVATMTDKIISSYSLC